MRAIGIIRRIDDLGRITLPKELRNKMGVKEGTPMEMYTTDNGVLIRKYCAGEEVRRVLEELSERINDMSEELEADNVVEARSYIEKLNKLLSSREE